MDVGTQLILSSTNTHVYTIFALIIIIGFNFYTVQTETRFIFLAKRLKKVTPYFHSINFIVAYTGAVLSSFTHDLNPTVILMIPTTLFLMITEIKRYKKMRVIRIEDVELQEDFKIFAKKIYTMQVLVIAFMFIIARVF